MMNESISCVAPLTCKNGNPSRRRFNHEEVSDLVRYYFNCCYLVSWKKVTINLGVIFFSVITRNRNAGKRNPIPFRFSSSTIPFYAWNTKKRTHKQPVQLNRLSVCKLHSFQIISNIYLYKLYKKESPVHSSSRCKQMQSDVCKVYFISME